MTLNDACDYIITKVCEEGRPLNLLKLQKLVFYAQAYRLAVDQKRLFDGKFQAWIHGPVSRELYDRFAGAKLMYSAVGMGDRQKDFNPADLDQDEKDHIDWVLGHFAEYDGNQLEHMTHHEDPWVEARKGVHPAARCENEISEETMKSFYSTRLK